MYFFALIFINFNKHLNIFKVNEDYETLNYQKSLSTRNLQQQESFSQTVCPNTVDFGTQYAFTNFNDEFSIDSMNIPSFNQTIQPNMVSAAVGPDYMDDGCVLYYICCRHN